MDTIAKPGDLGNWVSYKHNKSVEFGKEMASVCVESSGKVYKRHK